MFIDLGKITVIEDKCWTCEANRVEVFRIARQSRRVVGGPCEPLFAVHPTNHSLVTPLLQIARICLLAPP